MIADRLQAGIYLDPRRPGPPSSLKRTGSRSTVVSLATTTVPGPKTSINQLLPPRPLSHPTTSIPIPKPRPRLTPLLNPRQPVN